MSVPEIIKLELQTFKPKLKLQLGELVYDCQDEKQKNLMVITGFLPLDYLNGVEADYCCKWLTNQGRPRDRIFLEKELLKIKQ